MGKKKKYKADVDGSQVEDKEAEALEADDPTLDENGEPLAASEQGDVSGVDGGSLGAADLADPAKDDASAVAAEDAPTDVATDGASEPKPEDSPDAEKPIPVTDLSLPVMLDTADNTAKDQDGKVFDDHGKTVAPDNEPVAEPEKKEELAPGDASLASSFAPATTTDDADMGLPPMSAAAASLPADDQLVKAGAPAEGAEDAPEKGAPAVGSAEALEAGASEAERAPEPVDPASLPGMAPCNSIGHAEAMGNVGAPVSIVSVLGPDEDLPKLGDLHQAAEPLEGLDGIDGLKDAGNQTGDLIHGLKKAEGELAKLPQETQDLVEHVRLMALLFISALEAIFKRQ